MSETWNDFLLLYGEDLGNYVRALLILVFGLIASRLLAAAVGKVTAKRLGVHHHMLLKRSLFYGLATLFFITALHQMGFNLGILLGAAGIVTVALGFASQTSASNLISGLFLIAERPFSVGDIIRIGQTTGEVIAIDLLSVKLRTFDNIFVRIPNESMIKSEVSTLTRFPIRRFDMRVGVAYKEDIDHVKQVLLAVADRNPRCLEEPGPQIFFLGLGESSLNFQFSVWAKRENYLAIKNSIQQEVKEAFDAEGIEIPFPHRSLYAGSATAPFPVRVVTDDESEIQEGQA